MDAGEHAAVMFDEIPGCDEVSDCESSTTTNIMDEDQIEEGVAHHFPGTGFERVDSGEPAYKMIEEKLVSRLSSLGYEAQVEGMYRNTFTTAMSRARFQSFRIFSTAVCREKGRGNQASSYDFAWFGGSISLIREVLHHGFTCPPQNGVLGHGIHFSSTEKPLNSLLSAIPEANGERCMLLCRVILGNSEVIHPGSTQSKPSSREFDSGTDSLSSPTTYVVWSSRMNTHILPEAVVIFKTNPASGCGMSKPRIPLTTLVRALSRLLPCDAMEMIAGIYAKYKRQKIPRTKMIETVRLIAGDRLLLEILKSYMEEDE